jgi:hypothetical protein
MLRIFGFGERWICWMQACLYVRNLLVLVNGISTDQEGNIAKGLKQGDPLAHFLFLLVVRGYWVVDEQSRIVLGFFKPFRVYNSEVSISIPIFITQMTCCLSEKLVRKTC